MATKTKKKTSHKKQAEPIEADSTFVLKLVLFLILGSLWIKITPADGGQFPIPVGLVIGAMFAMHDHFQIDRKIEYALLLVAAFIGLWLPVGVFVNL